MDSWRVEDEDEDEERGKKGISDERPFYNFRARANEPQQTRHQRG